MRVFILLILLPVVSFLFTYTTECLLIDRQNPLKIKENWRNLIYGGVAAAGVLALAVLAYIRSSSV